MRSSAARGVALSVLAAATTWVTLSSWRGFVAEPSTFLGRLGLLAVVVAVLGAILRSTSLARPVVALIQTVAVAAVVSQMIAGTPLPLGGAAAEIGQAISIAVDSARIYQAPVSAGAPPVWPLIVAAGAGFLLLVDVVACTYRQVAGAGLALLAIYAVPSGLIDMGGDWRGFVIACAGFLAMLHIEAQDHTRGWGRVVGAADARSRGLLGNGRGSDRSSAWTIGASATALALALPTVIPVLGTDLFEFGSGGSGGDIRIRKPLVDMRRDLERGEPQTLIRFTTDDPSPSYLRVAVLNRFTGDEWSSGDRDVDSSATASGELPRPPGLSTDIPVESHRYDITAAEAFDSTWLPTTFPAAAVYATGDWRYDPRTLDFLAADDDLDTSRLKYSVTSLEPDYGSDGRWFEDARVGAVPDEVLATPGVSEAVRELARAVTASADDDYDRATLLQRWFREDGGFTYSLDRAPDGTGNETLDSFLARDGRVGYCEQYASAMAVMARTLGIPARVAVGFLRPIHYTDGSWEYTSDDLHAWPELYFDQVGWVRFEPTPADRTGEVPPYSRASADSPGNLEPTASATTAAPSTAPTGSAAPSQRPDTDQLDPGSTAADQAGGQRSLTRVLIVLAVIALVIALVAALLGVPALRRRRRAAGVGGTAEEVWSELRATTRDLGGTWPEGRSPREVGSTLAEQLAAVPRDPSIERPPTGPRAAPEAADALERIVHSVERARYARPTASSQGVATLEQVDLARDAQVVIAALEAGVTARARRRARWMPRSIWQR